MKLGVTLPQLEIGTDPAVIRDYARTAQALGYEFLTLYDHVLGADITNRPDWRPGAYTAADQFHEPFVLLGYLAAVAPALELAVGVIVLPQRQTALVAKQAAEVDLLTGGRFRLGVGIGWNPVEFEALGESFGNRGRRIEEQIEVMRLLWTRPVVTFEGRYHRIPEAGLNPLPVQRPIPVWMGGHAEPALERIGRLADGWMSQGRLTDEVRGRLERVRGYVAAAGRDPSTFGIEARLTIKDVPAAEWRSEAEAWRAAGAGYLAVNTMGAGLGSPRDHIAAIARVREAIG